MKSNREVKREPLDKEELLQEVYEEFEFLKNNDPVSPKKKGQIEVIAEKGQELAVLFQQLIPDTKEATVACNNLVAAVMWASKGIRRIPEIVVLTPPEDVTE
jgi:hypothetical protein